MSAVLLADVKTHLNITAATWDTELQAMIDSAETAISGLLAGSGTLASTAVTQRVRGGGCSLALTSLPVVSVDSVTDASGVTVSLATLDPDLATGLVFHKGASAQTFTSDYYTVGYHSGWATLPADLILAVKELVRHLWATQRGGTAKPGSGGQDTPAAAFSFPNRVLELVSNYTTPGFA